MFMKNILFVCSQNLQRSPTAEEIFRHNPEYKVKSAGILPGSKTMLDEKLLAWAETVFVMEDIHKEWIEKRFPKYSRKVIVLGIPDAYFYLDAELIIAIMEKTEKYLKV